MDFVFDFHKQKRTSDSERISDPRAKSPLILEGLLVETSPSVKLEGLETSPGVKINIFHHSGGCVHVCSHTVTKKFVARVEEVLNTFFQNDHQERPR